MLDRTVPSKPSHGGKQSQVENSTYKKESLKLPSSKEVSKQPSLLTHLQLRNASKPKKMSTTTVKKHFDANYPMLGKLYSGSCSKAPKHFQITPSRIKAREEVTSTQYRSRSYISTEIWYLFMALQMGKLFHQLENLRKQRLKF